MLVDHMDEARIPNDPYFGRDMDDRPVVDPQGPEFVARKGIGLHYNLHRYYDEATGRYVTAGPLGLSGGFNFYAYVGGNPLSYTDPLGLLVNWNGTGLAVAGVDVVGAGFFRFDLTSDCVN